MKNWWRFKIILTLSFLVLVFRLVDLQVLKGNYYQALADENRVRLEILRADRGVMYDRHGEILVRNTPKGRDYIYDKDLAHVLGYVGEADEKEIERYDLDLKDMVGKMGLEKKYDQILRGENGGVLIETDTNGEIKREIGRKDPIAGQSLKLTIDLGLQRKASQLMGEDKGALVASDSKTGEILAMISSPGFEPEEIEKYVNDSDLPMFNRALGGEYPPGSVFKIITATAGLEEGRIDESTKIEDTGEIKIGDKYSYGNWYYDQYGRKEGWLDITRAIARSNDIFFYKLGEKLGIRRLSDWAKYFGAGKALGIDLPGEANGLMPDEEWKKEFWNEDWWLGDTYNTAIGQGNILMTPLQVNQMVSVIASGGWWCRPYIWADIDQDCQKLEISQKTIDLVVEGMKQVCEEGGTAWPLFNFEVDGQDISIAGKTGTAEFGVKEDTDTHAWMTAFAPVYEPQIAVTVLKEAAGEGSNEAAPVIRDLLKYWFSRQ